MTLQERREQYLERCIESLKSWKDLIAEHLDDDDSTPELLKLKETTKGYCDLDHDYKKSLRALEQVEELLDKTEGRSGDEVEQLYKEKLKEDSTTVEYTDSDIWQNVFEGITDVMEVKQKKKKLRDNQFDELEDSMFCSNVFTPPVDPISKAVIREPVRSKKCKHVYERSMIIDYIKQQKRKAKCPYIGCSNRLLQVTDLVDDSNLQSQITQYLEAQDSEDEDTEEDD
ncbi:hypothetical protein NQ315_000379 [Exocentrus adspersus]|uniref:E3 SUMO-protein ligase NSE2 n=1 Tax=Exocentrus adspersus TaxID=1586481 RepID=A0AAV8VMD0_9CUCU|nr:hypothetical protein NQ315_000379 [Exocentrus adspersus]